MIPIQMMLDSGWWISADGHDSIPDDARLRMLLFRMILESTRCSIPDGARFRMILIWSMLDSGCFVPG